MPAIACRPIVPVDQTTTRSGSDYTSTVLIGSCYQPKAAGACTLISGYTTDAQASVVSGYTRMVRVIVTVTFAGSCSSSPCRYTTAALFDTSADQTWQTN